MNNNYVRNGKIFCLFVFTLFSFSLLSCATTTRQPRQYPHFITRVQAGKPNEWVRQDFGDNGTIFTQVVLLDSPFPISPAALITVGKIDNMLVAQAIVTGVESHTTIGWSFLAFANRQFNASASSAGPMSRNIHIIISDPINFIKVLQEPYIYNGTFMINMLNYPFSINGNLEAF